MMHKTLLVFFVIAIVTGCSLAAPKDDVGFSHLENVRKLAGCYQNLAEGGQSYIYRYLTHILWPGDIEDDKDIDVVRVVYQGAGSLRVTGKSNGNIVREQVFVEGKDFTITSGKITLSNRIIGSLAGEPGNVFIGGGHGSVTLGLDERGDGKLKETATFAGTAFLVIPVAGHVSESYRFRRLSNSCEKS